MKMLIFLFLLNSQLISSNEDFEELTTRNFFPFKEVGDFAKSIAKGEDLFDPDFKFRDCDGDIHLLTPRTERIIRKSLKNFTVFDATVVKKGELKKKRIRVQEESTHFWFDVILANQQRLELHTSASRPLKLIYAAEHNCYPDDVLLQTRTALEAHELVREGYFTKNNIAADFKYVKCNKTVLTKEEFWEQFAVKGENVTDGVRFPDENNPSSFIWQFFGTIDDLKIGERTTLQIEMKENGLKYVKGREYPC